MAYTGTLTAVQASYNQLSGQQKPDIDSVLKLLEPYQTPLMQFLFFSNKSSSPVINKTGKFSWFEDELFPHQTTVLVAITASTTLTLSATNTTDRTIFNLYDIVYIEATDEMAYVSSVTGGGGSDIVLTHIDGSSSLTSVSTVGSYLKIIGSNLLENNTQRTPFATKSIEKYNYLTIFSDTVGMTNRAQAGKDYTDGTDFAGQLQKKMKEMKFQFERNFMFSLSAGNTAGTTGRSYGQGFLGRVTTNVSTYTGDLTEDQWDTHLKTVFAKGSNMRYHFCGSNQLEAIQKFIKERYQVNVEPSKEVMKKYGIAVFDYTSVFGQVKIIWNPVMDGKFVDYGVTVDMAKVKARHMANDSVGSRKWRIEKNVQTPGADRREDKLLADIGIQIENEEVHGWLKKT